MSPCGVVANHAVSQLKERRDPWELASRLLTWPSRIMMRKSFIPLGCDLPRFVRGWSSTRVNGEQESGDQCDERLHGVHLKPAAVEG